MRLAYQHYEFKLRDAIKKNEEDQIRKLVKVCNDLSNNNIEVPILLKGSKNKIANELFESAFKAQWDSMLNDIKKFPQHAMLLNSAAWLGAMCDHDLTKCLEMAQKSVKIDEGAANLDTLAEVHFRLKNFKEAVKYIEKAASMEKTEPFFKDRVKKFKKAAEEAK